MLVIVCVMMALKFEVKKLTARSPFSVKTAGKVGFTSEI
jgi:hypothetical protein